MNQTLVRTTIKDKECQWCECFKFDGILLKDEAEEKVLHIVEVFNSSLRASDLPRELVSIDSLEII